MIVAILSNDSPSPERETKEWLDRFHESQKRIDMRLGLYDPDKEDRYK